LPPDPELSRLRFKVEARQREQGLQVRAAAANSCTGLFVRAKLSPVDKDDAKARADCTMRALLLLAMPSNSSFLERRVAPERGICAGS
jgi:hypothetical protein